MKTPRLGLFLLVFVSVTACFDRYFDNQAYGQEGQKVDRVIEIGEPLARPSAVPDRIMLTWEGDPATSQAVTWRTDRSVDQQVAEYAEATDGPEFAKTTKNVSVSSESLRIGQEIVRYHTARFTELNPNTKYVFRVGEKTDWSEWSQFTTASNEPTAFDFIYVGDAQNDVKSHWSRLIREAYKHAPNAAFILHAGDLIDRANNDLQWEEWFYATGFIHRSIPALATPGNHEYTVYQTGTGERTHGVSRLWRPTFAFPLNGPTALSETVYWMDYQGVRFVSLNSNELMKEQVEWLKNVLSKNKQKWTIVFFHHPIFSNVASRDNQELRNLWQPVFDEYKVDLVLQGHDHSYSRTGKIVHESNRTEGTEKKMENGTVYVVSVSGPKMYPVLPRKEFEKTTQGKQLFQVIRIDGDQLNYQARTATGQLFDAFVLKKENGNNILTNASTKEIESDNLSGTGSR
jgi:3',5'-cyclic AMP phosphodiesterase CpdA